jgi:signal transduction histidine kinase/DNA-binding response OmpR family regulator
MNKQVPIWGGTGLSEGDTHILGEDLKQHLQILLTIFDSLKCYGLLVDCKGIIKEVNTTFLEALGLDPDAVQGQTLDLLTPYCTGIKEHFVKLQKRDIQSLTFHSRLHHSKGSLLLLEQSLLQLPEDEQILCFGNVLHSLTENEEATLRKTEQQLVAANRLKRKFIANINHAIRTPMNAIIGYAEMLAESSLDEQQQRFVSTIRKNATALVSIINDVMELSKLETGNVKVLKSAANLKVVVEQAVDLFTDQIRAKRLECVWTMDPELPEMYVMDADHCRQVLINLVSNAVKFTERGGITVHVRGEQGALDWYTLFFSVTDTGLGLSPEECQSLQHLFEKQEDQIHIHDGTRLGLTLCARLAQMMGGGLTVESVKGQGSSFVFTMPAQAAQAKAKKIVSTDRPLDTLSKAKPCILVVDDMPEMSHLIKIYFTNSSITVLEASTGEECLRLAFSEQPNLIFMDMDLAGTDGREVAKVLREDVRTAHIPIVVMTGLMFEQESYKPIFDDFLAKPFHLHELQQVVDKYIPVHKRKNPIERLWGSSPALDIQGLQTAWNSDLEAAYRQAQRSGSLDDALTLGRTLEARGYALHAEDLIALGKRMKKCAFDFDIRGVEQILASLHTVTKDGL